MKKSRIKTSGLKVLESQFNNARGKSRSNEKMMKNDKELIFSDVSLEVHKNNWNQFSDWLDENYNIKKISKIEPIHVEKYIKELNEKGMSKKTMQSRISAVNKVMGGRWSDDIKPQLRKMDIEVKSTKENSYKQYTAQEWRDRNIKRYGNYKETFDTVSAFGLRKRELRELNEKSFLIDKNNKIYVQTIGKGGKYRIAECTKEKNDEMVKLYKDKSRKIDKIENFNGSKKNLESAINDSRLKLSLRGSNNERNSWHIFRNEYAQTLLKEKIEGFEKELNGNYNNEKGYSTINVLKSSDDELKGVYTQIGAYKGSALAFVEVSRNLGHNRLDIMLKYI